MEPSLSPTIINSSFTAKAPSKQVIDTKIYTCYLELGIYPNFSSGHTYSLLPKVPSLSLPSSLLANKIERKGKALPSHRDSNPFKLEEYIMS
jgi:hypothetical protein